jgi:hypothetical protein
MRLAALPAPGMCPRGQVGLITGDRLRDLKICWPVVLMLNISRVRASKAAPVISGSGSAYLRLSRTDSRPIRH